MDCIVGDEDICVEVTEADEAVRNALCFLTCDEELPSVEAEKAFLAYGRDGRDVRVCVEIKILRRGRAESSRRPPRHRRDACSMAWRCRFLIARRVDFHTGRSTARASGITTAAGGD